MSKKIIILFFIAFHFFTPTIHAQCWQIIENDSLIYRDVFFLNENEGWISAYQWIPAEPYNKLAPVVLKTMNGGETWDILSYLPNGTPVYEYNPPIFSELYFVNSDVGYAYGHPNSGLWKTVDGGLTWTHTTPWGYASNSLYSSLENPIKFVSPDTGWVNYFQGGVFKTSDGGETWEHQLTSPEPNGGISALSGIFGIEFLDNQTGWISTRAPESGFWRTVDGGITWERETQLNSNPQEPFSPMHLLNDSTGLVLGGKKRVLFRTTDRGETWEKIQMDLQGLGPHNYFQVFNFDFVNDTLGWGFGGAANQGGIIITKDGGESWKLQSKDTPTHLFLDDIRTLDMVSANNGWAVNYEKNLLHYVPRPACEEIGEFYVNLEVNNEGVFCSWESQDGCVDGYKVSMRVFSLDTVFYTIEEDVGLSTSYFSDRLFPNDYAAVRIEVTPYNYAYGDGSECRGSAAYALLTINELPEPIDTFICEGEEFYWDGYVFDTLGTYEIPYRTMKNRDSTLTINLLWYESPAQTLVDTLLVAGTSLDGVVYENDTIFSTLYPAASGCDSIVTYVINIVTDVKNPDEGLDWVLYPNPTSSDRVYLSGKYKWEGASLFNVNGQVIQRWQGDHSVGRHDIHLEGVESGIYFLRVAGDAPKLLRLVKL